MPTFMIINEKRVVNLDAVKEIKLSNDGTCVVLDVIDGTAIFIRDPEEARRFWEAIMNMPSPIARGMR